MIPVTLVKLDNYTGFLGTFDGINWWKTQPLPGGDIDYVNDAVWVYGQYHVCSAKLISGTYSIYRSSDNGYSWEVVKSGFSNIYCMVRTDYGIVIASTSDGWWRSTIDSGKTWTKISTQAPNCFFVREINSDILVALSSNAVWRSINGGVNWSQIKTFATTIAYPAIDGTTYDLILGVGKTMYYSDDAGTSWYNITGRMTGWPSTSTYSAITDIEMTKTFSKDDYWTVNPSWDGNDNVPCFVVQVQLTSGLLRHYYMQRTPQADGAEDSDMMFTAVAKFDAPNGVKNSLTADESRRNGSDLTDLYILFSGTDINNKPMLKKSTNGGFDWTSINVSNATVYSGPDLSQVMSGGSFFDDVYFTASWSHGSYCHNYWTITSSNYVRNQSYDMDFLIDTVIPKEQTYTMDVYNSRARTKVAYFDLLSKKMRERGKLFDVLIRSSGEYTYPMDVLNSKTRTKPITMDILNQKIREKSVSFDILNRDTHEKLLGTDTLILKAVEKTPTFDIISVLRFTNPVTMQAYVLKTVDKPLIADILYKNTNEKTFEMDVKIQETIVYDILHHTERFNPQFPAIGLNYMKRAYPIFDSREQVKE